MFAAETSSTIGDAEMKPFVWALAVAGLTLWGVQTAGGPFGI